MSHDQPTQHIYNYTPAALRPRKQAKHNDREMGQCSSSSSQHQEADQKQQPAAGVDSQKRFLETVMIY